jgi:hypothetical protein
MMMKKTFRTGLLIAGLVFAASCGNNETKTAGNEGGSAPASTENSSAPAAGDPKGVGPVSKVELTHPLDQKMVAAGESVYKMKCESCHKLTDEKLVGPGWKGVTDRRTPEWIMNFSMNTDEMIEKDPAAQKMLEECLVRMPNQNLAEADARAVLEFMRKNDGKN